MVLQKLFQKVMNYYCRLIIFIFVFFLATGKAFLVPELTKFAHRLFPRHLKALFSSLDLKVLQDMAKALQDEPWILGYQTVMKERFGLSGWYQKGLSCG